MNTKLQTPLDITRNTRNSHDDYQLQSILSIPNQSVVTQKALSKLTSCPPRVPFFLLVLIAAISGVWADNSPLLNEPVFHNNAQRGDDPQWVSVKRHMV